MRTLSAPTATATAKKVTEPGYLMQVGFSFVQHLSSRGNVTWNSINWTGTNLQVGGIQELPNGSVALSVAVGNSDLSFGAVCLNEAPQEKAVSIWAFYEGAIAAADPVLFFSGVIDSANINEALVTLQLSQRNSSTLTLPRRRITRAAGFSRLTPAGRVIEWGGMRIELTRG